MRLTTVGRVLARASSFRSISLCHNLRMSNEVDLAKLAGEAQKVFSAIPCIVNSSSVARETRRLSSTRSSGRRFHLISSTRMTLLSLSAISVHKRPSIFLSFQRREFRSSRKQLTPTLAFWDIFSMLRVNAPNRRSLKKVEFNLYFLFN